MGPAILFDKSAIQSLGQKVLPEVSRYFYTVVTPVLLMETLADLSLSNDQLDETRKKVAVIARKIFPINSIANIHYRTMCIHNLLGYRIPMDCRPVVSGGKRVVTKDGRAGIVRDIQPENEAVARWINSEFNQDDLNTAIQWRTDLLSLNLEILKHELPKPEFKVKSIPELVDLQDGLLASPISQPPLLQWLIGFLQCDEATAQSVSTRWKAMENPTLNTFAPYAFHCLRVQWLFHTGMMQGLFGTRPTNTIDLEYLYYVPFAYVFCSGDKLHHQLAPFVLNEDQSFVGRDEFRNALAEIAASRDDNIDAIPNENSLVTQLWLKHWKRAPTNQSNKELSEEEKQRIMDLVKPIFEAMKEQKQEPRTRFPG